MSGVDFYALPEDEQRLQIADEELEKLACPSCGRDRAECGDAHKDWYPQRHICYATRERAAADALYDRLHEALPYHDGTETDWAKKPDREHLYHYRDGVTVFVSAVDFAPDDNFLSGNPDPEPDDEVS